MPLRDDEIELLPDLVLARIVLGTLLVEFQARHAPAHRLDEIVGELPALRSQHGGMGVTRRVGDGRCRPQGTPRTADAGGRDESVATMNNDDLLRRRSSALAPAYQLFYDDPVHLVRGRGVVLEDADGRRFLDCYNNVASVGHCHPRVVQALADQAGLLNTHTRYLHTGVVELAERLGASLPGDLSTCFFVCSGTEAVDLAVEIARVVTGAHRGRRDRVVVSREFVPRVEAVDRQLPGRATPAVARRDRATEHLSGAVPSSPTESVRTSSLRAMPTCSTRRSGDSASAATAPPRCSSTPAGIPTASSSLRTVTSSDVPRRSGPQVGW